VHQIRRNKRQPEGQIESWKIFSVDQPFRTALPRSGSCASFGTTVRLKSTVHFSMLRAEKRKWPGFEVTTEAQDSRAVGTARHKSHRTIDPQCLKKSPPRRGGIYALTENVASPFHAEPRHALDSSPTSIHFQNNGAGGSSRSARSLLTSQPAPRPRPVQRTLHLQPQC
jgi:hypothetical protein